MELENGVKGVASGPGNCPIHVGILLFSADQATGARTQGHNQTGELQRIHKGAGTGLLDLGPPGQFDLLVS